MRLATYNVENLFDRAKVMNLSSWKDGKTTLEKFAALNALLGEVNYTATRRKKMIELIKALGLKDSDKGEFVILRKNRGKLLKRPRKKGSDIEIVAQGRADWTGSLELIEAPVDEEATRNTARVIRDLEADILAVVEVESRPALLSFNKAVVTAIGASAFDHVMVIDGNDERGIDVGLLTGKTFPINSMRSHVDDRSKGEYIFSRDCPEYRITMPSGKELVLLVNHLKSKGYGKPADSDAKRLLQAQRIKAVYTELIHKGEKYIAVVGDFNDTPDSKALSPLLKDTDLQDAFKHPKFDNGGYPGTYGSCTADNKIDYLLLSPALYKKIENGGVFRKGVWPGKLKPKWDIYPELTKPEFAASDHAAAWVDLDV